jgi:hypothetical protein
MVGFAAAAYEAARYAKSKAKGDIIGRLSLLV